MHFHLTFRVWTTVCVRVQNESKLSHTYMPIKWFRFVFSFFLLLLLDMYSGLEFITSIMQQHIIDVSAIIVMISWLVIGNVCYSIRLRYQKQFSHSFVCSPCSQYYMESFVMNTIQLHCCYSKYSSEPYGFVFHEHRTFNIQDTVPSILDSVTHFPKTKAYLCPISIPIIFHPVQWKFVAFPERNFLNKLRLAIPIHIHKWTHASTIQITSHCNAYNISKQFHEIFW